MRQERYRLVAEEMALAIRTGHLPAGSRLPTHRELAQQRGIALATATKVYRELAAAGLTVGEPGRGTYVRDLSGFAGLEPHRLPIKARTADLSFNQPTSGEQVEQLRRALRDLAGEGDLGSVLVQQPPGGRTADKAAVATHLLDLVHPASYSGWIQLPEETRSDQLAHRLAQAGILVSTGDAFATGTRTPNAIRIALATPSIHDLPGLLDRCRDIILTC